MKNKKIYLHITIILLFGMISCEKITNKIPSSVIKEVKKEESEFSPNEFNIRSIKLSSIPKGDINEIYTDNQTVKETQYISFNMQRLIEIVPKSDEGIVITNYTPANAYDIYVDFDISNEETVTLFNLDTIKAFTVIYIKYSDVFKDSIFYNSRKEKINITYVINNIKNVVHKESFKLNWDKGNNRYLDKLATIKTKWQVRIWDYYGNAALWGGNLCPSSGPSYEIITPFMSRVYICALINMAYLFSQDDFRELYLSLYLYDDAVRVLTVEEKIARIEKLLNISKYDFGITRTAGWASVGNGDFLTNMYDYGIKDCFASTIADDVKRGRQYDPFIYKDKVSLKDPETGLYRYLYNYGTYQQKQVIAHEFGHSMGFGHISNYTYPDAGNKSVYEEIVTINGVVQRGRFLASFQGGVELMHYKYMRDNSYPIREEDYFSPNDFKLKEPSKDCPTMRILGNSRNNHTHDDYCEVGK